MSPNRPKVFTFDLNHSALQLFVKDNKLVSMQESIRRQEHDVDNRFFAMSHWKGVIDGMTALHVAVTLGNFRMADFLLSCGADVNAFTGHPFATKVEPFYPQSPNWKPKIRFTPLHLAVIDNNEKMCKLLLSYKPEINALDHKMKTPLEYSLRNSRLAKLLIENGADFKSDHFEKKSLIFRAIKKRNLDLVVLFGRHQIKSVYHHNQSPLEFAMDHFPEAVSYLISFGRQIHFPNSDTGDYPIHIAVRRHEEQWVGLLCQMGCNPNAGDRNRNRALHVAVNYRCSSSMVLILLSFKADPNLKNCWGLTPLMLAVSHGNAELTSILLRMDARLSRNMTEVDRALRFKKFNTGSIILNQYTTIDESIKFKDDHILWFFVKQCVGQVSADEDCMCEMMKKLVELSSRPAVNSINDLWGTLMHFLIYANDCSPAHCYRPLFTALIRSLKCDIDKEFVPKDTVKNGELITVDRIVPHGTALSFALEMNDCEYFAEELIRLGADHKTINWDAVYFHPKKVKAFKLLVCVGASFPNDFRQYADPTLDELLTDEEVHYFNIEFDDFMKWWADRRSKPLSLKESCRNVIRTALGSSGCRRLDSEGPQILGHFFNPFPHILTKNILFRSEDSLDF